MKDRLGLVRKGNMKTTFWRSGILSVALAVIGLGLSDNPKPAEPTKADSGPPARATPAEPETKAAAKLEARSDQAQTPAQPQAAGESPTAPTNVPAPRLVQPVTPPADLKLSPGLLELVKMVHAGVSEEVLLAYIANSTNIFDAGADQIVYLNDLGVSSAVITAVIQHDASPETQARRQAAVAVNPLPENVKLKTPATNIYPLTVSVGPPTGDQVPGNYAAAQPVTPPPEPTPVGAQTTNVTPVISNVVQVTNVVYFYDALAPYGNWVSVPEYGLCWQPTVAVINVGWRPYCDHGRWIWTSAGWYWYSYYSWGWAPFHYGRWFIYPGYGWLWWPDLCWGPSWVTWRYTPYYCGWAPLPPRCGYVSGFGLYYAGSSVGFSFGFGFDWDYYTFIPITHFCHPNPHHYYVPRHQAKDIYKDSVVINNYIHGDNNTIINEGIGLERVAKVHRGEVPKAEIRTVGHWRPSDPRPERLERHDSGLTIVRPALPTRPPTDPASLVNRAGAGAPPALPMRPSHNPGELQPAAGPNRPTPGPTVPSVASLTSKPTPSESPQPTVRPERPAMPARPVQPVASSAGGVRPARPEPLPESVRPAPSTPATPSGSVRPAGAEPNAPDRPAAAAQRPAREPGSSLPTPSPAQPNTDAGVGPTRPPIVITRSTSGSPAARPEAAPVPGRSAEVAAAGSPSPARPGAPPSAAARPPQPEPRVVTPPAPSPAPSRSATVPSANAVPGFSRPTRPSQPVPMPTPSVPRVPEPRPAAGGSFYAGNPVVSAPPVVRVQPVMPVVPSMPSRPVAASSIGPAPSSRPQSLPTPSFSAPARAAPAPTPAPSGGGSGAVSRPSRPGRD